MDDRIESLLEDTNCYICMGALQNIRICPHCSKPTCLNCIQEWMSANTNPSCPNCRKALTMNELIKCPWVEDILFQMSQLDKPAAERSASLLAHKLARESDMTTQATSTSALILGGLAQVQESLSAAHRSLSTTCTSISAYVTRAVRTYPGIIRRRILRDKSQKEDPRDRDRSRSPQRRS